MAATATAGLADADRGAPIPAEEALAATERAGGSGFAGSPPTRLPLLSGSTAGGNCGGTPIGDDASNVVGGMACVATPAIDVATKPSAGPEPPGADPTADPSSSPPDPDNARNSNGVDAVVGGGSATGAGVCI